MRWKITPSTDPDEAEDKVVLQLSLREFDLLCCFISGNTSHIGVNGFWESIRTVAAQRWDVPDTTFREQFSGQPGALRNFVLEHRDWVASVERRGDFNGIRISRGNY